MNLVYGPARQELVCGLVVRASDQCTEGQRFNYSCQGLRFFLVPCSWPLLITSFLISSPSLKFTIFLYLSKKYSYENRKLQVDFSKNLSSDVHPYFQTPLTWVHFTNCQKKKIPCRVGHWCPPAHPGGLQNGWASILVNQ